jgi:anti-sigma B factor antagonist
MEIEKTSADGAVILAVSGALTAVTAEKFSAAVEPHIAGTDNLVFDFKDLNYLASAGLRVIVSTQKKMVASGRELVICNVSEDVMEVFEVTGLDAVLTFKS